MEEILKLSISEVKEKFKTKELSAKELVSAYLKQIEKTKQINAFIEVLGEGALKQAEEADKRIGTENERLLEGMPIGVKDLFCTKGIRTTAASKILSNFVSPYESTVTSNMLNAGGINIGKLNMDEFAMGSTNENSYFGAVINPLKANDSEADLVPGGSSGGSSACVAAYNAIGALGSDTGGSVRQPASFCGVVGVKPTYGRCSRFGMVAFASSLDQAGVLARNVKDSAIILEAISGYDVNDSTSANVPVPQFSKVIGQRVKGLKVGIPHDEVFEKLSDEVKRSWEKGIKILEDAGCEIKDISLKNFDVALPTYYIINPAEASSNLARYDGVRYGVRADASSLGEMYAKTRGEGFGNEVKRRIMIGTYLLSAGFYDAYYMKAQKVRNLVIHDFEQAFADVDVICTPTTTGTAFPIGKKISCPHEHYLNDVLTVPVNLAGLPAISVPIANASNGLPLGFQVIAPKFCEEQMFKVAGVVESAC